VNHGPGESVNATTKQLAELANMITALDQRLSRIEERLDERKPEVEPARTGEVTLVVNGKHEVWEYGPAALTLGPVERSWVNSGAHFCIRVEDTDEQEYPCWVIWEFNLSADHELCVEVILDIQSVSCMDDRADWIRLFTGRLADAVVQRAPERTRI